MARRGQRRPRAGASVGVATRKGVRIGGHARDPARDGEVLGTRTTPEDPQPSPAPALEQTRSLAVPSRAGWLPALSVVSAGALVAIAVADSGARLAAGWAETLFWLGLIALIVPVAIRLGLPRVPRNERIGLVLLLVVGAYLVKVLHGPVGFVFADEFAHERTVADILAQGRIFEPNPLSVVSPLYPGLELVTAALVSLTGMSIHAAAVLVVGVGRALLAVALFLLVERLSDAAGLLDSGRLAGIAAAIYAGNPNFTFWSAQYAYESLSLPLAILVILLCLTAVATGARRLFVVAFIVGLAVVVTHHLTSYALVGLLAGWAILAAARRRRESRGSVTHGATIPGLPARPGGDGPPGWLVAGLAGATAIWLLGVARETVGYLAPVIAGAVKDVAGFVAGLRSVKTLFRGDASLVSPAWERGVAVASVLLVAGLLGLALVRLVAEQRAHPVRRRPTLGLLFTLAGVAYFPLLALRALEHGTEISNRAGDFLFLPIGFLVAPVLSWLSGLRPRPLGAGILAASVAVVFVGGVIIGLPRWARLPGPYLASGDTRALQPETFLAADWLRGTFGTGNRLIADQTNALVQGSSGGQDVIHGLSWVYFSGGRLGHLELASLREAGVRFIVVDWRLTTMLPVVGYYFESGEPAAGHHLEPLSAADLQAFGRAPDVSRVFDSGDVEIYELPA